MTSEADGVPEDSVEYVGKMARDRSELIEKQALDEATGSECGP